MKIKVGVSEQELRNKVENFIEKLESNPKNLTGKVVSISKESETNDYINYKVVAYNLMIQGDNALYTGSNTVVCHIETDSNMCENHLISTDDSTVMTIDDFFKKVSDIIL